MDELMAISRRRTAAVGTGQWSLWGMERIMSNYHPRPPLTPSYDKIMYKRSSENELPDWNSAEEPFIHP